MQEASARKLIEDIKKSSKTSPMLAPLSNKNKKKRKNDLSSSDLESSEDEDKKLKTSELTSISPFTTEDSPGNVIKSSSSSTNNIQAHHGKIFKLARTLKRTAASERDASKPNDHPQNLKSFALSLIAGLKFIESGIKESQDSSRIFSDLIKYFEYFVQVFQKANLDQFYIIA
jgi:hypothetical protein